VRFLIAVLLILICVAAYSAVLGIGKAISFNYPTESMLADCKFADDICRDGFLRQQALAVLQIKTSLAFGVVFILQTAIVYKITQISKTNQGLKP